MARESKKEAANFKIEKGIALPSHGGGGSMAKYPWKDMEVGDSFFIPGVITSKITGLACAAAGRNGHRYACRRVDNGVRIWRIK